MRAVLRAFVVIFVPTRGETLTKSCKEEGAQKAAICQVLYVAVEDIAAGEKPSGIPGRVPGKNGTHLARLVRALRLLV